MNLNVYYLAISGIQKSVRRGLTEQALKCTKIAYEIDRQRLIKRLLVISFEECSRDEEILRFLYERPNTKDPKVIEKWITLLATSKFKSSNSVPFCRFLIKRDTPMEFLDDELFQELYSDWPEYEFEIYDRHGFPKEKEWILDICERVYKVSSEKLQGGVPYCILNADDYPHVDDCEVGEIWNNLIPYSAFDKHTRPGKFALNIYKKKHNINMNSEDFGMYLFNEEGHNTINRLTFKHDLWKITPFIFNRIPKKFGLENNQELNSIRRWVMEKKFPDETRFLMKS